MKKDLLYQYKEELQGAEKESFKLEGDGEYSEEVTFLLLLLFLFFLLLFLIL